MNTYPESKYPGLYEEIIKDHNFRFGKFSPIPYPNMNDKTQPIVVDWSEKELLDVDTETDFRLVESYYG